MNKRRLRAKSLILLPFLALVAVLATYTSLPGIDAIVQPAPAAQASPIASYRMQGAFSPGSFTVDRVEWAFLHGAPANQRILDADNLETVVEFTQPGTYGFRLTVFYDNNGSPASQADDMTITVVAQQDQHPVVDAGPDVIITEGEFAE